MQGEWAGVPVGPDVWETCRELIPERSVFAFLAEHRETLFPAAMFADMYPSCNGRPSYPPHVLSAVVVLQVLNGLSDAEAVQELRCDLRWKAACGLGLLDSGFDSSLLTYFRRRLQHSRDPYRLFTAVRQVVEATGILRGRHRRALDSTVFQDAVATQDTVTQLISAIRRIAREVPGGTETVTTWCTGHDYLAGPGKPKIAWDDEQARAELVDALVTDALRVLAHLPEQNLDERAANAVGILALVAGQDVEPAEDSDGRDGRWRIARRTAANRVISTVDPEARHIHKTVQQRTDGFKGHLAFEPETGLFTAVSLHPGSGIEHTEGAIALDLLADETGPLDVFGDTAYSGHTYKAILAAVGHRLFCKPAPLRPAVPGGFTLDDFHVGTTTGTVTCPAGHTTPLGAPAGQYLQRKAFFGELCTNCRLRDRCTRNKLGRILTIRPHHDQQAAARRQAATDPDWIAAYRRWRPPVERGIARLVAHGNRRLRYIGTLKNNTWLHNRAAALNLRRLINLGLTHLDGTWTIAPATP
ncbi:IS1182 family transposase [Streptomyces violascens]|uniref:IS1182 family transposase n=1 Tax=Streptomyces violascens TaxID=67381 RepID=UPI0036685DF6